MSYRKCDERLGRVPDRFKLTQAQLEYLSTVLL